MIEGQILLAGVGGQGVLFATRVLAGYAVDIGKGVLGSETHGMAQRGGSVISHLKVGDFKSPLVRAGAADLLFSLKPMETYRYLPFLRNGAACFVNSSTPDFLNRDVEGALRDRGIDVYTVDATGIAVRVRAPLSANLVLIGFAGASPFIKADLDLLRRTVKSISPRPFQKNNLAALNAGFEAWKGANHPGGPKKTLQISDEIGR